MLSRHRSNERVNSLVNLEACPQALRNSLESWILSLPIDESPGPTDLMRKLYAHEKLAELMTLTNVELAGIFMCSPTIPQRVKNAGAEGVHAALQPGRPKILTDEEEAQISAWIRERSSRRQWVTLSELKRHVVQLLEDRNVGEYPSRSFYGDLIKRLFSGEYEKRVAETVEQARSEVTQTDIEEYFAVLQRCGLTGVKPDLIINVDETGFGASRSGRLKSTKVIVPCSVEGRIYVGKENEPHYISAICGITASGRNLPPALITKRKTLPVEVNSLPIGADTRIYHSERAFVTRRIFQAYLQDVVFQYIEHVREAIGDRDARAVIIWDGHTSHYDALTGSSAAFHNVDLISIPPHSSHLLQALDRQYFKKVKQFYAFYSLSRDMPKICASILRVYESISSAGIMPVIIQSWRMTGIIPVVERGSVVGITLEPRALGVVDDEPTIAAQRQQRATRRVDHAPYGLLNETEIEFLEAHVCPFCMAPLPPATE